jgi:hypothetical protein
MGFWFTSQVTTSTLPMSVMGQKATSNVRPSMSVLPPKVDIKLMPADAA